MHKYIIFILGLGIIVLLIIFNSFTDNSHILEELVQKHKTTIQKIDDFIENNNLGNMTSQSKDFNLEYYSQIIKVGIIPYIDQNDPIKKELQEFINDLDKYTIDIEKLEKDNKTLYGDEMPVPTTL